MLGVLGGMGPMATLDFVAKMIRNTPAARDQDHIRMVVCQAANIPDRTEAILGYGADPFPAMRDALRRLEAAGADYIAIPCNTAHHWHGALQAETAVPILHIADAVVERLVGGESGPIGILATTGTIKAGIYQAALSKRDLTWRLPDDHQQDEVMRAVRMVKAGLLPEAATILQVQANALVAAGCQHVVMACTEIPIALANVDGDLRMSLIDSTEALAIASVEAVSTLYKKKGLPLAA